MRTENLVKACDSFDFFFSELREAHTDAVNSGNEFAEIALFSLIEQAAKMQPRFARVKDAALQTNAGAAKKGKAKRSRYGIRQEMLWLTNTSPTPTAMN